MACDFRRRCTELTETPTTSAIIVPVQCVASKGGSCCVRATMRSAMSRPRRAIREGRVLSRRRVYAFLHETLLPAPDVGLRLACLAHDLIRADAGGGGGEQDDLGSPRVLLRSITVLDDGLEPLAISGRNLDGNSLNRQILSTSSMAMVEDLHPASVAKSIREICRVESRHTDGTG